MSIIRITGLYSSWSIYCVQLHEATSHLKLLQICDRILENHPYGCKWRSKYLILKNSLEYWFLPIYVFNESKWPKITRKFQEILEKDFVLSAAPWQSQKFQLYQARWYGWFPKFSHIWIHNAMLLSYMIIIVYIFTVTWAQVICLKCMPKVWEYSWRTAL